MAINRRERFSVLKTEISESIEKLEEAIRLDKDLQEAKEKRPCLYIRLKCANNTLKEVQLMLELRPSDVFKKHQTSWQNEVNDIQDQLNINLQEISTIQRKLDESGLLHCTEILASQIRELIGLVNDGEMLEIEKMYQQSQIQIRTLEEANQRNEAQIWKLRSENENLKAVMQKVRDHIDKCTSIIIT